MNFDLDTKEGMKNAVAWTENMFSLINEGGAWAIPRSGTIVRVSHKDKTVSITDGLYPEHCLRRVIKATGWKIK